MKKPLLLFCLCAALAPAAADAQMAILSSPSSGGAGLSVKSDLSSATYGFTTNGTFTVETAGYVEYLAVGGGGAGGWTIGGGGGGGGVVTGLVWLAAGTYEVEIGAGGAAQPGALYEGNNALWKTGGNGGATRLVFGGDALIEAPGGGGGKAWDCPPAGSGGCGGGGCGGNNSYSKVPGSGTEGYGYGGGTANGQVPGGGGGAAEAGQNAGSVTAGSGGRGIVSSISGSAVMYGAGGGGGTGLASANAGRGGANRDGETYTPSAGNMLPGDGAPADSSLSGADGENGTGGGGGGGTFANRTGTPGGAGGSGAFFVSGASNIEDLAPAGFYRAAKIAVTNYTGSAALTNFPVLVRLSSGNFPGFSYGDMFASATGRDLAFTDAQGHGLPYDIDTWDPAGTSLVWVTLPILENGTEFAMFYRSGNDGKSICPGNAFSDYVGVWHMNEAADGVTTVYDSTTNDLYGTSVASSLSRADGVVGRARYITDNETISANSKPVAPYDSGVTVDMTDDAAKLALVDSIIPEFSASFWLRPQRSAPQFWYLISRRASDKGTGWAIQSMSTFGQFRLYGGSEDDQQCTQISGAGGFANGRWVKVDAVWNDTTLRVYVNGTLSKTATLKQSPTATLPNKLGLGGSPAPLSSSVYSGRGVKGDMDEIRLRAGSLSADWIAASYAQEAADAFLSYGAVESFAESAAPIATFEVVDIDQTSARYTGHVGSVGAGATAVDILAKTWPVGGAEPQDWTVLASGLAQGGSFTNTISGLSSETAYTNLFKAVNNMAAPVESEVATIPFTTTSYCSIELDSVEATNATFSVTFTGFGPGASSVRPVLEVCASSDFAAGVLSFSAAGEMVATGTVSISATGLAVSSQYWARATATNNLDAVLTSAPVQFTTRTPGDPVANASATAYGFNSYSAQVRVTAFGNYATDATAWLELSEDATFATVDASSAPADAPLSAYVAHSVTGLAADKTYHARFAVRNGLGATTYVALPDVVTPVAPFVASGPGWTAGDGTFDFALDVSAVYGGAVCTATLTYGGVEVGSVEFDDPSDAVAWSGVAARADGSEARIVVETTLDGTDYSQTFSAPIGAGSSGFAVSSAADYKSAEGALRVRPGDSIVLPAIRGPISYEVLNPRFASVGGNVVTALEPGIVGVRCVDAGYATNVMGVIVLPDPIGSGGVYIFKESKYAGSYDWSRPECWDKVGSAVNADCPTNADDIAIVPFYNRNGSDYNLRHLTDVSLAGLYVGHFLPGGMIRVILERNSGVGTKTLTFARSDGKPVEIKVCSVGEGGYNTALKLGYNYTIDVVWASDAVIDCCSSETDHSKWRNTFEIGGTSPVSTNTLLGASLTVTGYPGFAISAATCTMPFRGVWKGTGEIAKKGNGGIAFTGDLSGFSGTIRELSGPNLGNVSPPAAGVLLRATGASNVAAHVYGQAPRNAAGAPTYSDSTHGKLGTGGAAVSPAEAGHAPGRGLHLHGGVFRSMNIPSAAWGVGVKDDKIVDVLSVGAGWSYFSLQASAGNGSGYPVNAFTAKTLAHSDKGALVVYEPSCSAAPGTSVTNSLFAVEDWAAHAVGAPGDNQTTDVYPIIPWMIANRDDSFNYVSFATFDGSRRLVRPYQNATEIDEAASEDSNAYVLHTDLNHGTATNIVVNSLYVDNTVNAGATGDRKYLGASRTLTVKSGGVILGGWNTAIGVEGRSDNGSLVLGDAGHPAYVYAKANRTLGPNRIWSSVTAPGGFAKCYAGNLILGGDQTGIAGEIAVNAGTLQLGTAESECTLAKELPIRVCAGAVLSLPKEKTLSRKNPLRIDGSGGLYGVVDLASDQTCASLSVRDVFVSDDWTKLRYGTYGSSSTTAEYVRDDLFSGTGILTVGAPPPTVLSIR